VHQYFATQRSVGFAPYRAETGEVPVDAKKDEPGFVAGLNWLLIRNLHPPFSQILVFFVFSPNGLCTKQFYPVQSHSAQELNR